MTHRFFRARTASAPPHAANLIGGNFEQRAHPGVGASDVIGLAREATLRHDVVQHITASQVHHQRGEDFLVPYREERPFIQERQHQCGRQTVHRVFH
jgi:hypothetical protein